MAQEGGLAQSSAEQRRPASRAARPARSHPTVAVTFGSVSVSGGPRPGPGIGRVGRPPRRPARRVAYPHPYAASGPATRPLNCFCQKLLLYFFPCGAHSLSLAARAENANRGGIISHELRMSYWTRGGHRGDRGDRSAMLQGCVLRTVNTSATGYAPPPPRPRPARLGHGRVVIQSLGLEGSEPHPNTKY